MTEHPFFDKRKYPWSREDAQEFFEALCDLIQNPNEIKLIYDQCGEDLPLLALGQAPNLIWRDALDNLAAAGLLKELIEQVKERYPRSEHVQRVIDNVVKAQAPIIDKGTGDGKRQLQDRRWPIPKVALLIIALIAISIAAITYKTCNANGPDLKTVEGRVYYKQPPGSTALIPVEDVVVFLSSNDKLRSEPTDAYGRFSISGVPASSPIDLTAIDGMRHVPMGYKEDGNYPVIDRSGGESDLEFITTPWIRVDEPCYPDDNEPVTNFKVYSQDVGLAARQNSPTAFLTVELFESPETKIRSAHVLETPRDLYSNETLPPEKKGKAHTWVFAVPASRLKTKLRICLGSENPAALSAEKLKTYYKYREEGG